MPFASADPIPFFFAHAGIHVFKLSGFLFRSSRSRSLMIFFRIFSGYFSEGFLPPGPFPRRVLAAAVDIFADHAPAFSMASDRVSL